MGLALPENTMPGSRIIRCGNQHAAYPAAFAALARNCRAASTMLASAGRTGFPLGSGASKGSENHDGAQIGRQGSRIKII